MSVDTAAFAPGTAYTDERSGVRVLRTESRGSRAACVMVFVAAGSWFDPPDRSGLAHFYEHGYFAGAGGQPTGAGLADAIADLGCRFNAHTHTEYSYFYLTGPYTTVPM